MRIAEAVLAMGLHRTTSRHDAAVARDLRAPAARLHDRAVVNRGQVESQDDALVLTNAARAAPKSTRARGADGPRARGGHPRRHIHDLARCSHGTTFSHQ